MKKLRARKCVKEELKVVRVRYIPAYKVENHEYIPVSHTNTIVIRMI